MSEEGLPTKGETSNAGIFRYANLPPRTEEGREMNETKNTGLWSSGGEQNVFDGLRSVLAERDRYREALERIADIGTAYQAKVIARAALTEKERTG